MTTSVPKPATYDTSRLLSEVYLLLAKQGINVVFEASRIEAAHKAAADLLAALGVVAVTR